MTDADAMRRPAATTALVAAAYLAVTLLIYQAVLPAPRTLLPYPAMLDANSFVRANFANLDHHDQSMVVATVARNAAKLVTAPWDLFGDGQCYPMPRSYTLGEHMFGLGFLATLPYALTRDPILSFNFAVMLTLWIPAMAMYLFSLEFTRRPSAAFVAGLVFALAPPKLIDPTHPYVHGDMWAPLALLFVHRLLTRGGLLNALALALFMSLEVAESLYPLLSTAVYVGVYGVYGLIRHRANAIRFAPYLALAIAIVAGVAWIVLGPYLSTRAIWDVLGERTSLLLTLGEFMPGQFHFPGWIVLPLALIGLADRLRGPRLVAGEDPRLAITFGAAILLWCVLAKIPIPFTRTEIPSLLWMARSWIPGLDAVRALPAVAIGFALATSFLAGYGALVLTERLAQRAGLAVVATIAIALVAERSYGPLARTSFGRLLRLTAHAARPSDDDIALVRRLPPGALLDLPLAVGRAAQLRNGDYLLLNSYSPRPTAACYNSFVSPIQAQVVDLAAQLPDPRAVEALAALGFRSLLLHKDDWFPPDFNRFRNLTAKKPVIAAHLPPIGQTNEILAYRLQGGNPVSEDFTPLTPNAAAAKPAIARPPEQQLHFTLRNASGGTFRHPEPILPSPLLARWVAAEGDFPEAEFETRALLPIALAAGAPVALAVNVPVPDRPGRYRVSLARAAAPDRPIATREVNVREIEELPPLLGGTRTVEVDQLEKLDGPVAERRSARVAGARASLPFRIVNQSGTAFEPKRSLGDVGFRIEWHRPDGTDMTTSWARAAIPKVLSAKNSAPLALSTRLPAETGTYVVRLHPASFPEMLLDELEVQVDAVPQPSPTPVPVAAPGAAGPGA